MIVDGYDDDMTKKLNQFYDFSSELLEVILLKINYMKII